MRIGAAVLVLGLMISAVAKAQPISGSDWSLTVQRDGGQVISCGALKFTSGAEVRLAVGSQGSLALIVRDPALQNQLADVGLWKAGMIYSAQIFIGGGKPLSLDGQQVGAQSILIRLPYAAGEALKKVNRVAIALNGLAMRGYDISGVGKGYAALIDCAKGSGLIAR